MFLSLLLRSFQRSPFRTATLTGPRARKPEQGLRRYETAEQRELLAGYRAQQGRDSPNGPKWAASGHFGGSVVCLFGCFDLDNVLLLNGGDLGLLGFLGSGAHHRQLRLRDDLLR